MPMATTASSPSLQYSTPEFVGQASEAGTRPHIVPLVVRVLATATRHGQAVRGAVGCVRRGTSGAHRNRQRRVTESPADLGRVFTVQRVEIAASVRCGRLRRTCADEVALTGVREHERTDDIGHVVTVV